MTLSEFIEQFDKENSIILLAGKRKVLDADQQKLVSLGRLLASRTKKMNSEVVTQTVQTLFLQQV